MKAADLFVKCLENEGVEYIFAIPGEENLHLLESIRKSNIKLIVNRHEQCSAFMAATYGRLTGKAGVCLATLGPGATNLVTGIAHGQLGGMPMVAITGQKAVRDNWQAGFQIIDVVNMMRPLTKYSVQMAGAKSVAKEIRKAFKIATTERQGASHIELPTDIALEEVDPIFIPHPVIRLRRPIPDHKAISIAADMIRKAKQPIIIVSSRGQRNSVHKSLREFCDKTNIFVVQTQLGKGALGDDHKNSLYSFGLHKKDYVHCVVERADLVITIGYSSVEYPPSVWNKQLKKQILHIDFTPAEPDSYYAPQAEVIGDIAASLDAIGTHIHNFSYDDDYCVRLKAELDKKLFVDGATDENYPLRPRRIVADCRKALGTDDILCLDNGIYKLWFSRHYKAFNIGTVLLDNAFGSMGAGLPAAITAKIVHPQKKVLAVCGDGGFMMNSQELETAVRLGLNIVVLIVNDNGYGFIKWEQERYKYPSFGLDFGNPDFVKYAEAYGAIGYKVTRSSELFDLLHKAFQQKKPVIIECPIDYSENLGAWGEQLEKLTCPV
ncbi:MAG TPA: acetolactate synthase large subunit [Candidatus Nanoarchaeia archaeon]|nr:acetolactate synthase large subunit [Candidatus Nanoarchaeia archaeon]